MIQRRLLLETTLTFKKALELAQSLEAAVKNTKEIQNGAAGTKNGRSGSSQESQQTESVDKVATNTCYHCGKVGTLLGNAPSRTRNVIIAGKWATSKRPAAASKTQGVVS